jgi:hypothetical protein
LTSFANKLQFLEPVAKNYNSFAIFLKIATRKTTAMQMAGPDTLLI